jgi:hypothetical protein
MIPSKSQVPGFKLVSWTTRHDAPPKKGGPKNEGISLDVVENKCRKNVTLRSCVDIIENTRTYSFPQNMLMKNKRVIENEASVARPASPLFVPYVQGIAVAQALLPVRLAFVSYAQGTAADFQRREGSMVVVEGGSGAGGAGKKKLITIEAGICMKTNKTTTICPAKKRHLCITKRHFMQRHTSFAEIGGFLVTFRA